jgi:hypothetical protein
MHILQILFAVLSKLKRQRFERLGSLSPFLLKNFAFPLLFATQVIYIRNNIVVCFSSKKREVVMKLLKMMAFMVAVASVGSVSAARTFSAQVTNATKKSVVTIGATDQSQITGVYTLKPGHTMADLKWSSRTKCPAVEAVITLNGKSIKYWFLPFGQYLIKANSKRAPMVVPLILKRWPQGCYQIAG